MIRVTFQLVLDGQEGGKNIALLADPLPVVPATQEAEVGGSVEPRSGNIVSNVVCLPCYLKNK